MMDALVVEAIAKMGGLAEAFCGMAGRSIDEIILAREQHKRLASETRNGFALIARALIFNAEYQVRAWRSSGGLLLSNEDVLEDIRRYVETGELLPKEGEG